MAKITLYTDDIDDEQIIEAKKILYDQDIYPELSEWDEVSDEEAIDYIEFDNEHVWDEFCPKLEDLFKRYYCVVSGNYDSRYPDFRSSGEGGTVTTSLQDFYDLFKDCDRWTIEDEDGLLLIRASHHDGTLNVAVRVLTEAGVEWYQDYEYDGQIDTREEVETLFNSDKYSRKPYLAKELWYID